MRSIAPLCLFSVLLLAACGGDDKSDGGGLGISGAGSRAGGSKVSEMSRVVYTATNYRAVVSGSANPTRVLMEVTGDYWGLTGQYIFDCDESEHYCVQKSADGKIRAAVAISGDLAQIILNKYDASGNLDYTGSFSRN